MDAKDRVIADLKWRLLMVSKLSADLLENPFNKAHAKLIRDKVLEDNGERRDAETEQEPHVRESDVLYREPHQAGTDGGW